MSISSQAPTSRSVRLSILTRTLAVILTVAAIPSVGLVATNHSRTRLQQQDVENQLENVATAVAEQVDSWSSSSVLAL
ncbi:MAG: hypothetical protein AAFX40_04055 [Cyanobacteria bacterium J06639_1]